MSDSQLCFDDQVVIVTGAAGAIGSGVAEQFARRGAKLILVDQVALIDVIQSIAIYRADHCSFIGSVTDGVFVTECIDKVLDQFGRIDVLVTAAGITSFGEVESVSEDEWTNVLNINLSGTFRFCKQVLPIMRRQQRGRIVTIGSLLAKNGGNTRPWQDRSDMAGSANIAYGVSKAGVHAMTSYLAKDVAADGVTVNCVAPGPIATPMTTALSDNIKNQIPVGRMGSVNEVARAVLFLADSDSGFITGEVLDLNGGMWSD